MYKEKFSIFYRGVNSHNIILKMTSNLYLINNSARMVRQNNTERKEAKNYYFS
jgi:hypothetical protein